jgi:uncharacterized protein (TIGR02594 family)
MTPFQLAQRYVGIHELIKGDHPLIQWWLSLCGFPMNVTDEVAWCSAFVNGMCWELRLPRSKSAAARSWLQVGTPISISQATPGFDVVVLKRGQGQQPGPDVINAPGHVGFFAGMENGKVLVLAGNQGNAVSVLAFPLGDVLGIRRVS